MQQSGRGWVVYGEDVEGIAFDWGTLKVLSEPAVTGAEEIIFVMSGEGEQMIDDQPPIKVRPGASIYIPADIYHSTLNTGWEPLRLLIVYSPAGPERLLRDLPGCRVLPPEAHNA
jgi:oxalate decarboxylase/phosphoglucose isomerase-like protein (cupin superfamily)